MFSSINLAKFAFVFSLMAVFIAIAIPVYVEYEHKQVLKRVGESETREGGMLTTLLCMDLNGQPAVSDERGYAWNLTSESGIRTLEARLDKQGKAMRCMTREEYVSFFGKGESTLEVMGELNFYR